MADINNAIALDVQPPRPPVQLDLTTPLSTFAQLQMAQAHSALYGMQAQLQGQRLNALAQASQNWRGGMPAEQAAAPLMTAFPEDAKNFLSAAQSGIDMGSNRAHAASTGNVLDLQGPAAGLQGQNEAEKAMELKGRIGSMMLADSTPAGRHRAAQFAEQSGIPATQIEPYLNLPDDQWKAVGAQFAAATSAGTTKAAEAPYQTITQQPGEGVSIGPGMAAARGAYGGAVFNGGAVGGPAPAPPVSPYGGPTARTSTGQPVPTDAAGNAIDPATGRPTSPIPATLTPGPVPAPAPVRPAAAGLSNNKLNNPGNIADGAFARSQPGYSGSYNGFAAFESPTFGLAAMEKNLMAYGRKGIDTPLAIAGKWAPKPGPGQENAPMLKGNNPQAYAEFVAQRLGIGVNDHININDPTQRRALAVAMSQQENGANGTMVPAMLSRGAMSPSPIAPAATPMVNLPMMPGAVPPMPAQMQPATPLANLPVIAGAAAPMSAQMQPAAGQPAPAASPAPQPLPQPTPDVTSGAVPTTGLAADKTAPLPLPQRDATGGITVQPAMSVAQKAEAEKVGSGMAETAVKGFESAREGYQQAQSVQLSLRQLQRELGSLPQTGMLTSGSGAVQRIGLAKAINTALTGAGLSPAFDPKDIGTAETAQKITGRLGFDLSRALGAREAAQIVQQAISFNPGVLSTPLGAKMVTASINAAMQRQKDYYAFMSEYANAHNGNPRGADVAFDRARPVGLYAQEAQRLARVPQAALDNLDQHPDSAPFFEQKYGDGLARYFQ